MSKLSKLHEKIAGLQAEISAAADELSSKIDNDIIDFVSILETKHDILLSTIKVEYYISEEGKENSENAYYVTLYS